MYSSLEKLDLGVGPKHGEYKLLIQTDHRDAIAITDDAPLSIVFAITRCLIARAAGDADPNLQPFRVVYQLSSPPPAFLAYAVGAAGAAIAADPHAPFPEPSPPRTPELVGLIDDACGRIAAAIAVPRTVAGLAGYERALDVSGDEHGYYAAIVSLGALVAAVARAKSSAAVWRHVTGDVVPFRFGPPHVADRLALPVFALAKRYVDARRAGTADHTDQPSTLLGLMFGEITTLTV